MRSRARPGAPAAAAAPGTASSAAGRPTGLQLIAGILIAAAGLDLTRCSLVLMTFRHVAPTIGLVAAGIGAAAASVTAARGYRAGQHWAAWAALLIGVTSAPQASASGFHDPYTIPDVATAALGVLLTIGILATVGRTGQPVQHLEVPCTISRDGPARRQPGGSQADARSRVSPVPPDHSAHPPVQAHWSWSAHRHEAVARPGRVRRSRALPARRLQIGLIRQAKRNAGRRTQVLIRSPGSSTSYSGPADLAAGSCTASLSPSA
jgi:hypothetical protein